MSKLAEYVATALIESSAHLQNGISVPLDRLRGILLEGYEIEFPEEVILEAVRILINCEIAYAEDDEFAGRFVVISSAKFEKFIERVAIDRARYDEIASSDDDANFAINMAERTSLPYLETYNRYPVIRKYSQFGEEWLRRALQGINSLPSISAAEIPASDRVVRIDDNDQSARDIRESAAELRQKILRGNDLGQIDSEQAQAVVNEIGQLEAAFEPGVVRPQTVAERAKKTLKWIGEKAAGTIVGKAALSLLAAILAFLGLA